MIANAAWAQPLVTDEVVWRTTSPAPTYRPAPQAARVAVDGGGFVVAWSEVEDGLSRAYAGRLDAGGHLISVGVRTGGTADAPSVAPFGDRYLAAWVEPGNDDRPFLVTGALDRDFKLLSARRVGLTDNSPIVRTTSSRAYVASGNFLYELDKDGAPLNLYDMARRVDDFAAAADHVGSVHHSLTNTPRFCGFFRCSEPFDTYELTFTWLYRLTKTMSWRFTSDAPPAIGANGVSFLVVWFEPPALKAALFGSTFDPFSISSRVPTVLDRLAQPQVAWDGARWVAVWPAGGAIEGAAISPDLSVTPFRVAAKGSRPCITAARSGRFLVTYESVDLDSRRLASRLIDFASPGHRERAVR